MALGWHRRCSEIQGSCSQCLVVSLQFVDAKVNLGVRIVYVGAQGWGSGTGSLVLQEAVSAI
jgi:hypothetical protein